MICPTCHREVDPAKHFYSRKQTPRCDRPFARIWTEGRRWKLMEGLERGWTDKRIGAWLDIAGYAVLALMLKEVGPDDFARLPLTETTP